MNQQARENRAWLRARMDEQGLTEKLLPRALSVVGQAAPAAYPWARAWARAYSDGHNNRGLRGRRLDHYASAFADICEEVEAIVPELEMTLDAFYLRWEAGGAFEGTAGEHWHPAYIA